MKKTLVRGETKRLKSIAWKRVTIYTDITCIPRILFCRKVKL